MIAQLVATAMTFRAQLAKRLFARSLVLRQERNNYRPAMAYAKVGEGRWRRGR
jgi:hypothetical protein